MVNWVAIAVSLLVILGSGITAYSNLNSNINVANNRMAVLEKEVEDLDDYDIKLSEDIDDLNGRMIRSESEQTSIRRTQDRIESTMKEMLREIKGMREDIIKMGTR